MPQRVLLLGAYANGNIGDMYQADSISGELMAIDSTLQIYSTSPSKRGGRYPAEKHTELPQSAVRDPAVLNSFDLILVGGGGLLAAPHAPLPEVEWVNSVETTMCGLSLGCAGKAPLESRAFVEKCKRFSVRDEFSAEVVAPIRSDIEIIPDPIFLGDVIGLDVRAASAAVSGILWIPGKLVPNTLNYYSRLVREIHDAKADSVVSFNEETDKRSGFEEMFGPAVRYLQTAEGFTAALGEKRFGVSERYHGCILALKMEVPCFGLVLRSDTVTSKITELYRRLGLQRALIRDFKDLDRKRMNSIAKTVFDFKAIAKVRNRDRAALRKFLQSCLDAAATGTPDRQRQDAPTP